MDNLILVTDWDAVDSGDFLLSDEWIENTDEETMKEARELQKRNKLFYGYIVDAKNYAIYYQMDANEVLINDDGDVIIHGESHVIGNEHKHKEEYNC